MDSDHYFEPTMRKRLRIEKVRILRLIVQAIGFGHGQVRESLSPFSLHLARFAGP